MIGAHRRRRRAHAARRPSVHRSPQATRRGHHRRDPEGRPTVYELLADVPARVVPVGRLDLATSGLLLFTNDTRFGEWLTNPDSGVPKVYLVTVRGRVTDERSRSSRAGVRSAGDTLYRAAVVLRKASARESHLVVTLTEGKNREVRRLCAATGHEVTRLRRVQIGGLTLGALPPAPGAWSVTKSSPGVPGLRRGSRALRF